MSTLSLALYCEGPTDGRFLPLLIRRICQDILSKKKHSRMNVLPIDVMYVREPKRDQCILQAAIKAHNYHALIVHADADHPTRNKALLERYQPGYDLVQQYTSKACKNLVPIIPIHMAEAWILADHETLREFIKTNMEAHELGLPIKAKQVEADSDPKATLKRVLQKASAHQSRRHRRIGLDVLYEPLARTIRLERLNEVPAYKQFVNDLTGVMMSLKLLSA